MNSITIDWLNQLDEAAAQAEFQKCCGSSWWCERMERARPFADEESLKNEANRLFDEMPQAAWMEAFDSHPKIGVLNSLRMRLAGNNQWSRGEQAGIQDSDEQLLADLAAGNAAYEAKFGYIFIVCASGLSAKEMLSRLNSRIKNEEGPELRIACYEQRKITHLRLDKLEAN